jgi:hypothetical protein
MKRLKRKFKEKDSTPVWWDSISSVYAEELTQDHLEWWWRNYANFQCRVQAMRVEGGNTPNQDDRYTAMQGMPGTTGTEAALDVPDTYGGAFDYWTRPRDAVAGLEAQGGCSGLCRRVFRLTRD